MNDRDLETRIRSYYRTCDPADSTRLLLASQVLLDNARRPQPRRLWGSLRLVASLALAVVLLAVLVLPRLGGQVGGPAVGSVPPAGPTFDSSAASHAQVDRAGLIRTGGIWAVQGSYLLTSKDNGATWRAGTIPALGEIFVLDQDHAWVIESNWVNASLTTPAPAGGLFVLDRTSDGGRTWQSAVVPGDFRCDRTTTSFVDASRGFIMCSTPSTAGPNGSSNEIRTQATKGSGTVLQTTNGGASWAVAGSAAGLGAQFTAVDATTLWSAADGSSSNFTGVNLMVSRDAGLHWSTVDLPDMYPNPIPGPVSVNVADGPTFWDAADGAIAVGVYEAGTSAKPAMWFYRTSDGGTTWSVFKEPKEWPSMGLVDGASGRTWAVAGDGGLFGLKVSADFGATWTAGSGSGMPENTSFLSLDLVDKDHAIATVFVGPGASALMLTSDGGRTWHAADFGDARAKLGANAEDPASAKGLADNYAMMATKSPPSAWNMLSGYSQRAFGSESAFEVAMVALGKRTNYALAMGEITNSAAAISQQKMGQGVWSDLNALADMSRAYTVALTFPGSSEPPETLVLAPLSATGEWQVWVVTTP